MEGIVMHLTCMYYRRAIHFLLLVCFANEVHYFLSLVFFCDGKYPVRKVKINICSGKIRKFQIVHAPYHGHLGSHIICRDF